MTVQDKVRQIQEVFDVNAIYAKSLLRRVEGMGNPLEGVKKILQNDPKPFVKWVGGKRQLLRQFRKIGLYPPDAFDPRLNSYFEPFAGGGAVFFDLHPARAYLSDLNWELVKTYNVIKKDVSSLIRSLKKHKYDKDYFLEFRAKDPKRLSDIEVASRFIFLNRTCYNGIYRVNSKGEFNVPFGKYDNPQICDEENLRKVSLALSKVEIECQDYKEIIKKARKGDFIYFDPPYHPVSKTADFTSYTSKGFSEREQVELSNVFYKLHKRGCFVMLSNSDSDFIKELYVKLDPAITIHNVEAGRMVNSKKEGRKPVKEIVVINYPIQKAA